MIPKQLQRPDFRFVKVCSKKNAIEDDWQNTANYEWNNPLLQKWIEQGKNYGVIGGYGKLLVIDFDDEWAYNKLKDLLPETFVVKTGGKSLHYYYFIDDTTSFIMRVDTGEIDE